MLDTGTQGEETNLEDLFKSTGLDMFESEGSKVSTLIEQKMESFVPPRQKPEIQKFLISHMVRKMANIDSNEMSDVWLSLLLDDKRLFWATRMARHINTWERTWNEAIKSRAPTFHTIWMMLGQAR